MPYQSILFEIYRTDILIVEKILKGRNKGFYGDNVILLDKRIQLTTEKTCVLAEELGHHHTTVGDITDQTLLANRKQERRAREWAHRRLIPFSRIIDAHHARIKGRHDLAEFLGVTEEFLQASIDRYTEKYGLRVKVDERYIIYFDPLGVLELFP